MTRPRSSLLLFFLLCSAVLPARARADGPFLGEIRLFAGNYAPAGWMLCEGQLLPISQNEALFLVLGDAYGGDGVTTFALPDLRGRVPVHAGDGPGLPPRDLGERGGAAVTIALNVVGLERQYAPGEVSALAGANAHAAAAGGRPDDRMPPFLGLHYIIAVEGTFPPRP